MTDLDELEALLAKATPVKLSDLIAYDHGGGRLAVVSDTERTLVADFYGDGTDRDFFMALRNAAPAMIAELKALRRATALNELIASTADEYGVQNNGTD